MRHNLYVKILAKMDARIKNAFGETKVRLAPKTLIDLAKQIGYVEGIRGPSGGYTTTDKGLEYLGYNLDEFAAKEQKQTIQDLDEVRRKQREASQQRAAELAQMMAEAQKEFIKEQVNEGAGGLSRRSSKDKHV